MNKKLLVLSLIAKTLNEQSIIWALGASGMLYLNGMTDSFHDLDIMIDENHIESARTILNDLGTLLTREHSAQFQTKHFLEYLIEGVEVDVISGFVIVKEGVAYHQAFDQTHIERHVTVHDQRIPLQCLSDWAQYYTLMGRPQKAAMCIQRSI